MITKFNQKELMSTNDLSIQIQVCNILKQNSIDYKIKVVDRNASSLSSRNRTKGGSFGERLDIEKEYIIFVKKNDLEMAQFIINKK